MLRWRPLRPFLVVENHVLEPRNVAINVERKAFVGNRVEQDAAGSKLAQVVLDRRNRVVAVLQEVVGNDEVERTLLDPVQTLAVIDDVDLD